MAKRQWTYGKISYPVLLMISLGHLLNDTLQSLIPSIYPILKAELGLSFTQIGMITLVFQMTSSLLQPFTGLYADRRPRPYFLSFGMCFTFLGLLLLSFAGHFSLVLFSVAFIGMGSSIFHPTASRVAQLAAHGQRGLGQSIFQFGGNAGTAIGPLLAALIVLPYGQRAVSGLGLIALLGALLLFQVGRWYRGYLEWAREEVSPERLLGQIGLTPARVRWAVVVLVVLMFSKHLYMAAMTNYFTFFLMQRFGVSVGVAQYALFAFLFASALGTIWGGVLGDRYGRKYVIWGSILGAAPFALLLPHVGFWGVILLAIIVGLVISSAFSAILVYATDLMPQRVGMIAGVFFGLSFGLGGLGSALFGYLADLWGIEAVFLLCSFLPLLGVVAGFLPRLENKKS